MTQYKRIISVDEEQVNKVEDFVSDNKSQKDNPINETSVISCLFPNSYHINADLIYGENNPVSDINMLVISLQAQDGKIIEKRYSEHLEGMYSFTDFVGNIYTAIFAQDGEIPEKHPYEIQSYDDIWIETNGIKEVPNNYQDICKKARNRREAQAKKERLAEEKRQKKQRDAKRKQQNKQQAAKQATTKNSKPASKTGKHNSRKKRATASAEKNTKRS